MGLLHGLAGSGSLSIIALSTAPSVLAGVVFILLFGTGTTLAMVATSLGVAFPFSRGGRKSDVGSRVLRLAVGSASTVVGMRIVVEMGLQLLG